MRSTVTFRKLFDAVTSHNTQIDGIDIPEEIIIEELSHDDFLDLLIIFQDNTILKSVKIDKITNPDLFDPDSASSMKAVVCVNTTLRRLDFGDAQFKKDVIKPFIKVLQQLDLDELNMSCQDDTINERLAYVKKRNTWLIDVSIFYLNQYILNCEKGLYGNLSKEIRTSIDQLKIELDSGSIKKIYSPRSET